jgi:hypothetical protein
MRRIGRSKFNTILSRPRIDISEAYFLNAHMRELISSFQSSPILVFQLCEKNSGGKCEKESPENVLNVPDFWAGEVRKSRSRNTLQNSFHWRSLSSTVRPYTTHKHRFFYHR